MKSEDEFKRGDIIIQICSNVVYKVTGAYESTLWYELGFIGKGGGFCKTCLSKDYVEENYVKIGHSNGRNEEDGLV